MAPTMIGHVIKVSSLYTMYSACIISDMEYCTCLSLFGILVILLFAVVLCVTISYINVYIIYVNACVYGFGLIKPESCLHIVN